VVDLIDSKLLLRYSIYLFEEEEEEEEEKKIRKIVYCLYLFLEIFS
jgi:hypothetical protein